MSQELRDIKWSGRPPVIEVGETVSFSLDGETSVGTITAVTGRTVRADGKAIERGQVTFTYEDVTGMKLTQTVVGPK
jgi:hypothetical protein